MTPTVEDTASTMIRILDRTETGCMSVSRVREQLSQAKKRHLADALNLLVTQGQVELRPGRKDGSRHIQLIRPITPVPHCPTCTCHDIL